MKTETIKGFTDFQGAEAKKRAEIQKIILGLFERYGFEPAETPIVENREFVQGENPNDEAVSDIFKLEDRGKRKLALRYEFTFQLKRLMKNQKLPYKRYQIGPVFRDEPTTGNRLRQFTQCDIDIIGSSFKDEAEILLVAKDLLNELNLEANIYVNNRKLLNEILDEQGVKEKEAVIKELDKLDKLSEKEVKENLKKYKAEKLVDIFKQKETFFKKYNSYKQIQELKNQCKLYGLKINFQPTLARGLSYYNGSVFEVKAKGIKETIIAGGSYMFNKIQSTGISFGLDRLSIVSNISNTNKTILVISINQDKNAIETIQFLREQGINCSFFSGKPGKALEYANAKQMPYVILIGDEEVKSNKLTLKNMDSGKEEKVSLKKLADKINL